jgi:acyl carrier protein
MCAPSGERTALESILRDHPNVADVAVFSVTSKDPAVRVAAVVTSSYCGAVDLRDHVWEALEQDDLPDLIATVPALPRRDDGGLDVDTLGNEVLGDPAACTFAAPATATEIAVGAVWMEVLGRGRVGADDNFLDLGGDSMTGILLLDLITERLDISLSFDELLSTPTLRDLATLIAQRKA